MLLDRGILAGVKSVKGGTGIIPRTLNASYITMALVCVATFQPLTPWMLPRTDQLNPNHIQTLRHKPSQLQHASAASSFPITRRPSQSKAHVAPDMRYRCGLSVGSSTT